MKLIRDPHKKHWAIGLRVTCSQCTAEYELENVTDFISFTGCITSRCPNCKHSNRSYNSIKLNNDYKWDSYTITSEKTVDWNAFEEVFKDFDKVFDDFKNVFK